MPLQPPQRNAQGTVDPYDHAEILADHRVIRRIHEKLIDRRGPRPRLSSMAYKASSEPNGGMSIDLEQSIISAGLVPKTHVTSPHWIGSVVFRAGDIRALGFRIGFEPLAENQHHGEVWGTFSRPNQRALSRACTWFVEIEGVSAEID